MVNSDRQFSADVLINGELIEAVGPNLKVKGRMQANISVACALHSDRGISDAFVYIQMRPLVF